ncbi:MULTISPECIES: ABC transporter permease [unclassified Chelatococcus]|uniref:ABC transporter permease n=1 Tax=unclassified Chelatococcus TaxID=2638111 RepID=UPI001BD1100E|nr:MULTISPECIES: ABC transporter permease [unclassified Chelatococcus]MBS7697192.1 ABC transporter permease [Chelatococcus sp. YT9]MBX3556511.1 ABC transporter permease [Chelatococcus sp.]
MAARHSRAKALPAWRHLALGIFTVAAVIFILAPLAIVILTSFSAQSYAIFPPEGYSLRWYANLAAQTTFYVAALRSLILALVATAASLVVGTMTAYALVRYRPRGHSALKAVFLSPVVLPKMVLGVAVFMLVVKIGFYGSNWNLVLTHTLICVPFVIAIVAASLANFDWSLQEAALDLGSRPLPTFLKVILPQISVSVFISGLLAFVTSFDQVETTMFLMRPGESTLPIEMFLYLQRWQDPTIAALSSVLIVFAIFLLVLTSLVLGRRKITTLQTSAEPGP